MRELTIWLRYYTPPTLLNATTTMSNNAEIDASSPEALLTFYRRLYPFKSLFHWLNHEHVPTRRFTNREFAFNLPGDVYIRYNSFSSAEEMKSKTIQLNPSRFEIGAVYSARVSHILN